MVVATKEIDWTAVVQAHHDRLAGLAFVIVGDRQDAADVVQTAFEKAYRARGRFDVRKPIEGWLIRITCNEAKSLVRRRRSVVSRSLTGLEASRSTTDRIDDRLLVEMALGTLDAKHRAAVGLYYLYGYGIDEVAQILHVPRGTVASRLHYARLTLERLLDKHREGGSQ
jgi:RNA polymerase sigma-70 factor (ECF subfamily)